MLLTDLLNKSQKYAEAILAENKYEHYLLSHKEDLKRRPDETHNQYRVGLLIKNGVVANYRVG